jgi:hypothetical protein
MELDLIAWVTDSRLLQIVFCAACVSVLRALAVADQRRDRTTRGESR